MSPEKRSAVMSRIRSKHTGIEEIVAGLLSKAGMEFDRHAGDLQGRPDFVFRDARVVVFVDGDFCTDGVFPFGRTSCPRSGKQKSTQPKNVISGITEN